MNTEVDPAQYHYDLLDEPRIFEFIAYYEQVTGLVLNDLEHFSAGRTAFVFPYNATDKVTNYVKNFEQILEGSEVFKVIDRLKGEASKTPKGHTAWENNPSPFEDIFVYFRSHQNIDCLFRHVSDAFIANYKAIFKQIATMNFMSTSRFRRDWHFVIVIDNFHIGMDLANKIVIGFKNADEAYFYMNIRMQDKLTRLREESSSLEELRLKWILQGENFVLGKVCDYKVIICSDNIDGYLVNDKKPSINWMDYFMENEHLTYCELPHYSILELPEPVEVRTLVDPNFKQTHFPDV